MTLLLAAVPVIELRGAIPLGLSLGLPEWAAYAAAVIGNMLPTPLIILFTRKIFAWLRVKSAWLEKRVSWLEERAEKKAKLVYKYAVLGLFVLVAIPLPGTGAWTGALVAALMNIRMKNAIPTIFAGVLTAGVCVLLICMGVGAIA